MSVLVERPDPIELPAQSQSSIRARNTLRGTIVLLAGGMGWLLHAATGNGIVLAVATLAISILPSILRRSGMRLHPLDPETYFPLICWLASGYTATIRLVGLSESGTSGAEAEVLLILYVGCVACAFATTLLSTPKPTEIQNPVEYLALNQGPMDVAATVVGATGLAMVLALASRTGFIELLSMSYGETFLAEAGLGFLSAGWYLIHLSCIYMVARIFQLRAINAKIPIYLWVLSA